MVARRVSDRTAARLEAEGFKRCFIADEPRLSEAVETYEELDLEVVLAPVGPEDGGCTECMRQDPGRFWVIYTRARPGRSRERS